MAPSQTWLGVSAALASALLFGFVNVVAKGGAIAPLLLSGLAYLVAGLMAAPSLRSFRPRAADLPVLLLMAAVGGVLAPAALFTGLQQATAVDASLLLTCEMVFTSAFAAVFLAERLRPLAAFGVVLLLGAAIAVALGSARGEGASTLVGVFLVLGAALGWAVDNILGTRLMGRYRPVHMLAMKGLPGGAMAIALHLASGGGLGVAPDDWWRVLFIGGCGIGAAAFCFYVALRTIGATRTSALCLPTSALAGAMAGAIVLHEALRPLHAVAATLLMAGVTLVALRPSHGPAAVPGPA